MNDKGLIENGLLHSIHTSERKAFRGCRRRWDWSYRQNYHPTVTAQPLEFGTAYHASMECWYDPEMWFKDRQTQSALSISTFKTITQAQFDRYEALNGAAGDLVKDEYRKSVQLGIDMVKYYTERVSPLLDKNLRPLAVEVPFEVPLDYYCDCDACWKLFSTSELGKKFIVNDLEVRKHHGSQCACIDINDPEFYSWRENHWRGLPVTFGGRIDAIFEDNHGRILVFDWKTTSRLLDSEDEAAFLELDDQVGGYPAALYKLGKKVDGFIYHEQLKKVPVAPEKLEKPYRGRAYSVNKQAGVEYMTALNTVVKYDQYAYNNGLYDDYLKFLEGPMRPKFYQRHTVLKTDTQMDNFWSDLILESQDMLDSPSVYPQASRFSCNSCAYRQPCEGQSRGEDYMYTLNSLFTRSRA